MAAQNLVKHTYTANHPDGGLITRTTTRAYEFVVFALINDGHYEGRNWIVEDTQKWAEVGWAGSKILALKAGRQYSQVEVVPVNNPRI